MQSRYQVTNDHDAVLYNDNVRSLPTFDTSRSSNSLAAGTGNPSTEELFTALKSCSLFATKRHIDAARKPAKLDTTKMPGRLRMSHGGVDCG